MASPGGIICRSVPCGRYSIAMYENSSSSNVSCNPTTNGCSFRRLKISRSDMSRRTSGTFSSPPSAGSCACFTVLIRDASTSHAFTISSCAIPGGSEKATKSVICRWCATASSHSSSVIHVQLRTRERGTTFNACIVSGAPSAPAHRASSTRPKCPWPSVRTIS